MVTLSYEVRKQRTAKLINVGLSDIIIILRQGVFIARMVPQRLLEAPDEPVGTIRNCAS